MNTDNLRGQHRDILAIIDKMQAALNPGNDVDVGKSEVLRKLLVDLSGCVTVHLIR